MRYCVHGNIMVGSAKKVMGDTALLAYLPIAKPLHCQWMGFGGKVQQEKKAEP